LSPYVNKQYKTKQHIIHTMLFWSTPNNSVVGTWQQKPDGHYSNVLINILRQHTAILRLNCDKKAKND